MIGAAMLWVGWFGFNGGSQLAADGGAAMATDRNPYLGRDRVAVLGAV